MTKTEQTRIINWLYAFAKKQNDNAEEYKNEYERLKELRYSPDIDENELRKEMARYHRYRLYCEGTAEHLDDVIEYIRNCGITQEDIDEIKIAADKYANETIKNLPPRYCSDEVINALKKAYLFGSGIY